MSDLIRMKIACPHWGGELQVARPTPTKGDQWGCLSPLRGTPWGDLIPIVKGEAMSNALHGDTRTLLNQIGPHPHSLLRMIPLGHRRCEIFEKCLNAMASDCHPCSTLPDCYDPPGLEEMQKMMAAAVAVSWRDSVYVVVLDGAEFSL